MARRHREHIDRFRENVGSDRIESSGEVYSGVFGIPIGGRFVAIELAVLLDLPLLDEPTDKCLVVDDTIASGRTMRPYVEAGYSVDVLFTKGDQAWGDSHYCNSINVHGWVTFPWEHHGAPEDAVVRLLEYVGQDPKREGIKETPARYLKALKEMTSGYGVDVKALLSKRFPESYNEMVVVSDIDFWSLCEHHLLPFHGTVAVGYLPGTTGGVVGLSKLARLVQVFAQRIQVQERMTAEIVKALEKYLVPNGSGCVVRAKHTCMSMRGIKSSGVTTTSYLSGVFKTEMKVREEFLALARV